MSKNVICYMRVSTKKQQRSGLGLEAQEQTLSRYTEQHGYTVLSWEVECCGAGKDDRTILQRAIKTAKAQQATILVSKLDRLSRRVSFIATLMESKVPFEVAEMGPEVDTFMLHIYAAVAEKERAFIGQRTREALAARRARGLPLGSRQMSVVQSAARRVNETAFRQRVQEFNRLTAGQSHLSNRQLAVWLNDNRIPSPRGRQWSDMTVRSLRAKGTTE